MEVGTVTLTVTSSPATEHALTEAPLASATRWAMAQGSPGAATEDRTVAPEIADRSAAARARPVAFWAWMRPAIPTAAARSTAMMPRA